MASSIRSVWSELQKKLAHFKERFTDSLKIATAVYRDAAIEVDDQGLTLKPSRPPVAPRIVGVDGKAVARVQGGRLR